ncbi:ABSCISIC ACID-INSENSITIVE 5-like protein 2 [Nymphaea colorata]|nr:ABSCISIC ACID-INSENSITIVE 5-like protein 2 [Nymphaea colorata]XP_031481491.1 ABSCISIC ACID-INSENSITIVE 5-like protein 2 [Nymphaea colorata]
MLHSESPLLFIFSCLFVNMKRQVPSADWGSPAAWSMGLEQEDGGGLMEGIGGGGGWGALMADAGNETVDDYAGMQHQVGVMGRRDGLRKKATQNIVEKKQKRMVKNRESAARSRARKQAYTSQLEYEIAALTKENQLLLKYGLFEKMAANTRTGCPQPLRRTFSATF